MSTAYPAPLTVSTMPLLPHYAALTNATHDNNSKNKYSTPLRTAK